MSLLIVGCGFLGEQVAAVAADAGLSLALTSRSAERAATLAARFGPTVTAINFDTDDAAARLAEAAPDASHALVLLTPSACLDATGQPYRCVA